jgi:hypothetical protein
MRSARLGILALFLAIAPAGGASAAFGAWEDGDANLFIGNLSYHWASQIARAANEWNDETNFTFDIKGNGLGACDRYDSGVLLRGDEHVMTNGVEFNDTMCGMEKFPPGVLAVTQFIVADGFIQVAGIVFNNEDWKWDVYHGPVGDHTIDFHRVAVHELGHFLGLEHTDAVSIMQPFVSDEIEDIQPFDVETVNGIYGPDGAPAGAGDPPPAPQSCQVMQLKASAKLCKAQLGCQAKHAKDPSRDADGAKRDACASAAEADFVAAWDAAVAAGVGGCGSTQPGGDVVPMVTAASDGAIAAIGDGEVTNTLDTGLRAKLLKKASALCGENFNAWKKEAQVPNIDKLATALARSRAHFVEAGGNAISKATGRGVSYDGAELNLVADGLETLANDVGAVTGD